MNQKDLLLYIATIANRNPQQGEFLFKLCDCDMFKYIRTEAKLRTNYNGGIPATKETLEVLLASDDKLTNCSFRDKFKFTYVGEDEEQLVPDPKIITVKESISPWIKVGNKLILKALT